MTPRTRNQFLYIVDRLAGEARNRTVRTHQHGSVFRSMIPWTDTLFSRTVAWLAFLVCAGKRLWFHACSFLVE